MQRRWFPIGLVAALLAGTAWATTASGGGRGLPTGCNIAGEQIHYSHGPRAARPPRVALTFDDGPERNTRKLIELLDRFNVKATFYPIASQIAGREALQRREIREGHIIANHTYSHYYSGGATPDVQAEIQRATRTIRGASGFTPCLFRAPFADKSDALNRMVRRMGMITTFADVDPADYEVVVSAATIRQRVLNRVKPGSIVVMHEDRESDSTLAALPGIIRGLRERGYRFVTVTQMFGIPLRR